MHDRREVMTPTNAFPVMSSKMRARRVFLAKSNACCPGSARAFVRLDPRPRYRMRYTWS